MKFNDSNCRLTYTQISTKSVYQFQELSHSKTDLYWMAEMISMLSGLGTVKQMFSSSHMMLWMKVLMLIAHDLAENSNCHWWTHLQQFLNLLENLVVLLQFNSIMHMDEGLIKNDAMFVQKNGEKLREKVEEFLDLDLNFTILLWLAKKTVMI